MMLKRRKFVIQWRKFGLKRSCIFKVMNFWSLCLFLIIIWFLNEFLKVFSIKKIAKRGFLLAGADVASGSSSELTRGTRDHCTGATRRWGHMAEPLVAHAGRRRRTERGHVAGGHAYTRVHVGARVGCHVAGKVGKWRAHGLVGPGKMLGAVTQMRYRAPHFIDDLFVFSFRVGLCSHTTYLFCRWRGRTTRVGFHQDDGDRVDPSPRDRQLGTCAKSVLSDGDRKAYLLTRGIARIVRFPVRLDKGLDRIIIRSSVDGRDFSRSEASRGHIGNVWSSSDARDYSLRSDGRWTPRDQAMIRRAMDSTRSGHDQAGAILRSDGRWNPRQRRHFQESFSCVVKTQKRW